MSGAAGFHCASLQQTVVWKIKPDALNLRKRLNFCGLISGILARIEETSRGASFTRSLSEPAVTRSDINALLTELLGFTLPVVPLANLLEQTATAEMSVYGPWRAQILSRFTDGSPQRLRIDGRAGQTSAAPLVQLTIFVEA